MPYELRARHGGKLIIIRHSGNVDCDEIAGAIAEVDSQVDPKNLPSLLVDVRGADSFPDQEEFFARLWQNQAKSPRLKRLAMVTSDRHAATIDAIASEQITRGLMVRVFHEELEALTWLMRTRDNNQVRASEAGFRELATARIFVSDIGRAREFYGNVLRLGSFEYDEPDHEMFFKLDNVGLVIHEVDRDDAKFERLVGRCTGLSFRVLDIDATFVRLRSLGVTFSGDPEKRGRSGRAVDFEDPDGNVLTLVS